MSVMSRVRQGGGVDLNRVAAGMAAGAFIGGVVGGLGARISMRFVAILSGAQPGFSLGGTLMIVFIGAILGLIFGLVYSGIRRYLPGSGALNGLVFGATLFLVFVVLPFWLMQEGELALVSPWMGILLFGPLPLAYGAVLAVLVTRLEARMAERESNRIGIGWLALYGALLTVTLIGGLSLADPQLIFPSLFVWAYKALGLSFATARSIHALLIAGFFLAYCGMASALLWSGTRTWMAQFAAVSLLAFSAAFFNDGEIFRPGMNSMFIVRWLPGLLRSAGLMSLLLLLFWFPDGRFTPGWTRPLAIGLGGLLLVIFVGLSGNETVADLEPLVGAIGLACGALALGQRYRSTGDPVQRAQILPFVRVVRLLLIYLVLLGAGAFLIPAMRPWESEGLESLFAIGPYLLPWLLLPAVLVRLVRQENLWRAG